MTFTDDEESRLPNGKAGEMGEDGVEVAEGGEKAEAVAMPEEGQALLAEALAAREADLEAARRQVEELREQHLRLLADVENMRRRFQERERRLRGEVTVEVLRALLPGIDNLERAVRAAGEDESPLAQGVRLSLRTVEEGLARLGAVRFDALGEAFDPARHEALVQEERADVEAGRVVEVFAAGWLLHDQVVRPALVKVAR
jgi:molecular chaperone GrpE